MNPTFRTRLATVLVCASGLMWSNLVGAVDNGRIQVTVPSLGVTTLKLFDSGGTSVPSARDPTVFTGLKAGAYILRSERADKVSEARITVQDDETCVAKVSDQGDAELLRCFLPVRLDEQQQRAWSLVALVGFKQSPFDASVTSNFGMGNVDLNEDGGLIGLEGRYHLSMPMPGSGTFVYGGYDRYLDMNARNIGLNFHFGLPNDSGARIQERDSLRLGVGHSWRFSKSLSGELMAGMHGTRVRAGVISDESEGGGPRNEFSRHKTLWGGSLSVGASFPIASMPGSNRPVRGIARYTANWMPDIGVAGTSPFTASPYRASIKGGRQDQFQFGVQMPF